MEEFAPHSRILRAEPALCRVLIGLILLPVTEDINIILMLRYTKRMLLRITEWLLFIHIVLLARGEGAPTSFIALMCDSSIQH